MKTTIVFIFLALALCGSMIASAMACSPDRQMLDVGADHSGHDEAAIAFCANHICCAIEVIRTQIASIQMRGNRIDIPDVHSVISTHPEPPFKPPIPNLFGDPLQMLSRG